MPCMFFSTPPLGKVMRSEEPNIGGRKGAGPCKKIEILNL